MSIKKHSQVNETCDNSECECKKQDGLTNLHLTKGAWALVYDPGDEDNLTFCIPDAAAESTDMISDPVPGMFLTLTWLLSGDHIMRQGTSEDKERLTKAMNLFTEIMDLSGFFITEEPGKDGGNEVPVEA